VARLLPMKDQREKVSEQKKKGRATRPNFKHVWKDELKAVIRTPTIAWPRGKKRKRRVLRGTRRKERPDGK